MARYAYECKNKQCGVIFSLPLPMGTAPSCVNCSACGMISERVYTAPQLNTRPALFSDANKQGLVEVDATRKADDKKYAKKWDQRMQQF